MENQDLVVLNVDLDTAKSLYLVCTTPPRGPWAPWEIFCLF
jgi:hypothetical protein